MAFRALFSQPRAANPCAADATRVASAAASGAGTNPLTSFLTSVSTDPLRTRQLLEGYDLSGAVPLPQASLPDALLNLLSTEDLGEPDAGVGASQQAAVSDSWDTAWSHIQGAQNGGSPPELPQFSRPTYALEGFRGLAGPETIGIQMSPDGNQLAGPGAGRNASLPETPFLSNQASLPSGPHHVPGPLPAFLSSSPSSSSSAASPFLSVSFLHGSSGASVSPQPASPFPAQAPHAGRASAGSAPTSWLEEFHAFAQGRDPHSGGTSSADARDFAPQAAEPQGPQLDSSTGRQGTPRETRVEQPGSSDQPLPADAVARHGPLLSGPVSFPPPVSSPFLAFPHPPPQVPFFVPAGHLWNYANGEAFSEARQRSLEAARRAQRAAGILPASSSSASSKAEEAEKNKEGTGGVSFDARAAREMLETLKAMGEEKLERSEFVHFIRQLAAGELSLVDGQLVNAKGSPVDWDAHLQATKGGKFVEQAGRSAGDELSGGAAAEKVEAETGARDGAAAEEALDGNADECASFEQSMKDLEEAWKQAREKGEIDDEELSLFRSIFNTAELGKALGDSSADEASLMGRPQESDSLPVFSANNPYLSEPSPLALAQQLLEEGKLQEAVKALEAEVQQNPSSSEGWRLLGEALADSEQDAEAIVCLKKGHEVDPYNLDSLLALGVSLTNELDAPQALRNLRDWMANHDEFSALPGVQRPLPEDFQELKAHVASLFHEAAAWKGCVDGGVHLALGVIHNIDQNFDRALYHFAEALKFASGRRAATLWNKIGATLANSGRSAAALLAYEQTVALRPNYPRAWTNLGVAHSNLGDTDRALRFYLTALVLNPAASHLWYYVRSAIIALGKFDWLGLAENRDLEGLRALMPAGAVPVREEILEKGVQKAPQEDAAVLHRLFGMIKQST
ncbi:putative TPR domain-containing protein [Neospora caninum Liverpool]|uniref:Putative TPR domain-containing protein n=1 Tax=Neospora caninum (strain Liverpool) TaxID=572307 RepID=F0VI40_NEOCL|nr:putative TPR domain-containing protein [Neospora caninum Liverpool]CBZ53401.1 putative TPR domain-containing protein [Neospora caninum Liverpool]|eukprot:XP_003883433.1 putative TPR domain-containing protein [Neospora caninum Liverpool]